MIQRTADPDAFSRSLRTDIDTSRSRLEETLDTLQDTFEQRSGLRALMTLQDRVERTRHQVANVGRELSRATEKSPEALSDWVQERPLEVLAVAFVAGVLLGARPFQ